ncbi:MAG: nicotinic acid mononucleotide adenyltransferase [Croceitalea sp.]|nr:nicotinic acid mononucleotide adenyltransferase [Croceitalea sp.]
MKNILFIVAFVFSLNMVAQELKPKFEKIEADLVKATYFHDNGEIAQTGFLLKGKLHGDWFMYDIKGKKIASGSYENGERAGKWFFWNDAILKEVDFVNNRIADVKNWNQTEVVTRQ